MATSRPTKDEIFNAAAEIVNADQRAAYVETACAGDVALRAEIHRLLAHDDAKDSILDQTAPGLGLTLDPAPVEYLGTLIGPYKLLEVIGEGGMGVVYLAEQKEPVERRMALKIIKPGMDSRQVIGRFEAERQALALMEHPNIAKVLDAGTTESGRPYFVMELVNGRPITQYCDERHLTPRQRLELFIPVCQAVQHAHQKGIIHRDLKPSNVLVAEYDEQLVAKVIDFGVSKAVGQRLTERTVFTELGQVIGTIEYMSPEQAKLNQLDIDTRTDIYSLGVLLYELLTGSPPFDKHKLRSAAFDEMLRIIREEEPPKPSTKLSTIETLPSIAAVRRTEPARLTKMVRGELDWIVMKCLEKDRARRYETANGLAMDIERYLRDEPVVACPPSAIYRFRKFARKHSAALTTAVLLASTLILGTVLSTWQAVRATKAEAQANANANLASANAQEAKLQAQEASARRNEARQQRDEAQKQRDVVKGINETLRATQAELRETLYAAHMKLAHNNFAANTAPIPQFLNQYVPKAGEPDLRGFEWHYLQRLLHPQLLTIGGRTNPVFTSKGHTNSVFSVAYSPDGQRLASASQGQEVKVWDSKTGRLLRTLNSGGGDVLFSPDGKRRDEGLARARHRVEGVAFSPDGQRLASGRKVWDLSSGNQLLITKGHGWIRAYSPDGKRLAGSGYRGAPGQWETDVIVWDAMTGEEVMKLNGHTDHIDTVAYSPDGKLLASASHDRSVKLWDAQTGQIIRTYKEHPEWVLSLAFTPDGKILASGSTDKTVHIWETATGKQLHVLKGFAAPIFGLGFSPDGQRLASASSDAIVRIWNAETGDELVSLQGHLRRVLSVAFSPDGRHLVTGGDDSTVKVWDPAYANQLRLAGITVKRDADRFWGVAFSPDGKQLVSGSGKSVKVLEAQTTPSEETGKELLVLEGHAADVFSVAYSPNGKYIASGSLDNTIKIWDAATGKDPQTLTGHTGAIRTVAFSPDSRELASVSDDKTVKLWDVELGETRLTLQGTITTGLFMGTKALAFSPDGKRLASGSDNSIKIWDVQSGRDLFTIENESPRIVLSLAFSPDGRYLARSGAMRVKIRDIENEQDIRELRGHFERQYGLAYSPDGKRFATAAMDGTVKIWNPENGQEMLTLRGHEGRVCHVAFSPDGYRLASTGVDGTLRIWDATPLTSVPDP